MGEGVSLPLPRNGFPVANHFVVLDPFSRENGLYGSFNLQDFQAAEGKSCRISLVGSVNLLSYVVRNGWAFGHLFVVSSSPDSQSVERDSFSFPRSAQIGAAGWLDEALVIASCADLKKKDLGWVSLLGGPRSAASSVMRVSTNEAVNAGCCIAAANDDSNVDFGGFSSDLQRFVLPDAVPFRFENVVRPRTTVPRGGVAAAAVNADDGVASAGSNISVCSRRVGSLVVVFVKGESTSGLGPHGGGKALSAGMLSVILLQVTFFWVSDLVLADFQIPAPNYCWGLSLDSNVDTQATPNMKTAGGSGCLHLHRRLGIQVYSVGYELGFPDLGIGNIVIMLAGIPDNVSATVISEKEMVPKNETVGKTMGVGITHCYDPFGPENSGSHVDVQPTPKTKTAGGIGLTELVPSPEPSTLKKVQLSLFFVSDLSATRGCFFLQMGSSSHYRKMIPISLESGVIKSLPPTDAFSSSGVIFPL